jgi:signal transduction histidine kinase
LARLERIQKRLNDQFQKEVSLLSEIQTGWSTEYSKGGMTSLTDALRAPSNVMVGKTLLEEDLANLGTLSKSIQAEHDTLIEDAKFLSSEGQRINRIVSQMRSLSHIKREFKIESAHKLLKECCHIMADLFDKDAISLALEAKATSEEILVNKDEFIQLITNMLRNSLHAIRMSESSKGIVILRTQNIDNEVIIDVIDNGIGLKEEEKMKLFANHFSTKDPSEGTGMGLSIARRFARGFNGDVVLLKSEFGSGTTFRISIPQAVTEPMRGYGT